MKILGHLYVALRALPNHDPRLLAWGSILPEMMFYIKENPFRYEEIHEGGEKVIIFLAKQKPKWVDLGLGIMAHSQKTGADFFDKEKQLKKLGSPKDGNPDFERELAEALNLKNATDAKTRVHNILGLALDLYIAQNKPWVFTDLKEAFAKVPTREIAEALANCFKKPKIQTEKAVRSLKDKINLEDLTTAEGLAKTWSRFSLVLPERKINVHKTAIVIRQATQIIHGHEETFLNLAIKRTRQKIRSATPLF